jgi:hypothetical protein
VARERENHLSFHPGNSQNARERVYVVCVVCAFCTQFSAAARVEIHARSLLFAEHASLIKY